MPVLELSTRSVSVRNICYRKLSCIDVPSKQMACKSYRSSHAGGNNHIMNMIINRISNMHTSSIDRNTNSNVTNRNSNNISANDKRMVVISNT